VSRKMTLDSEDPLVILIDGQRKEFASVEVLKQYLQVERQNGANFLITTAVRNLCGFDTNFLGALERKEKGQDGQGFGQNRQSL